MRFSGNLLILEKDNHKRESLETIFSFLGLSCQSGDVDDFGGVSFVRLLNGMAEFFRASVNCVRLLNVRAERMMIEESLSANGRDVRHSKEPLGDIGVASDWRMADDRGVMHGIHLHESAALLTVSALTEFEIPDFQLVVLRRLAQVLCVSVVRENRVQSSFTNLDFFWQWQSHTFCTSVFLNWSIYTEMKKLWEILFFYGTYRKKIISNKRRGDN